MITVFRFYQGTPLRYRCLTCGGMMMKSFSRGGGISLRSVTSTVAEMPRSMKRISITLLLYMFVI